jgi:transcriptional regulator with XRE-family HTH domain
MEIRTARAIAGMTTRQVARRAGVAASTEARVEVGDPGAAVDTVCAVAEAVGLDIVLRAYPGRQPSLRDMGQLELAHALIARVHPSLKPELELLVGQHGEAIDTVLFGASEIVAVEFERLIVDVQAQLRRSERKREALAELHQRPVRLIVVIEDTRRNRAATAAHLDLLRTALPAGSREVLRALGAGTPIRRDGLLWLRRRRRQAPVR